MATMISTGLKEFVAVVESGGFTAAANALDVSTSFVSRQVKKLEDRLDTLLLHRTTRAVRLTDMGRIFYERSREILDDLATLESEMADLQERPKGRVRISEPGFYAEQYVAPALIEFMDTGDVDDRSERGISRYLVVYGISATNVLDIR